LVVNSVCDNDSIHHARAGATYLQPRISSYRWWPGQEVLSSSERFYPASCPHCSAHSSTGRTSTSRSSCGRSPIEEAGLEVVDLVSVEGLAFILGDLDARMADPVDRPIALG
jgi:hypothetical protein